MKQTAVILAAVISLAAATHADDLVIELGSVTIPDAAISDVQEWLETQVQYETVTTIETRTDPDTGESVDVPLTRQVVVVENPRQKLTRIMKESAKSAIRDAIRRYRLERVEAEAQAAADALPDPVTE